MAVYIITKFFADSHGTMTAEPIAAYTDKGFAVARLNSEATKLDASITDRNGIAVSDFRHDDCDIEPVFFLIETAEQSQGFRLDRLKVSISI